MRKIFDNSEALAAFIARNSIWPVVLSCRVIRLKELKRFDNEYRNTMNIARRACSSFRSGLRTQSGRPTFYCPAGSEQRRSDRTA
jgi:hypothetical protein